MTLEADMLDVEKLKKVLAVLQDAAINAQTLWDEYRPPGDPPNADTSDIQEAIAIIRELIAEAKQ